MQKAAQGVVCITPEKHLIIVKKILDLLKPRNKYNIIPKMPFWQGHFLN